MLQQLFAPTAGVKWGDGGGRTLKITGVYLPPIPLSLKKIIGENLFYSHRKAAIQYVKRSENIKIRYQNISKCFVLKRGRLLNSAFNSLTCSVQEHV